jgi:WhiB family redox-sensing transcriptional regulator
MKGTFGRWVLPVTDGLATHGGFLFGGGDRTSPERAAGSVEPAAATGRRRNSEPIRAPLRMGGGTLEVPVPEPETLDPATAWMRDGNCRAYPPAVFFPSDGAGVEVARRICESCPVRALCLEYALEQRVEHGVWGGCSERERRRIAKRRRAELAVNPR